MALAEDGENVGEIFLEALKSVRQYRKDGRRAVHKPLLLLYALARVSRGEEEHLIPYAQALQPLRRLLSEFGPTRKSNVYHAEYPFVRLQNDGIWETRLPSGESFVAEGDPGSRTLLDLGVAGGFRPPIHRALLEEPDVVRRAVALLLEANFPHTLHEEILTEVGFQAVGEDSWALRTRRDPMFRRKVLLAYEYHCAVCGFHLQMDNAPVGLDAAHIRWKQERGPDVETNGLALCTLHHRLFDRGAFTVGAELNVRVSRHAVGDSLEPWLMKFHGERIRSPQEEGFAPAKRFLAWHGREVFRAPARSFALQKASPRSTTA